MEMARKYCLRNYLKIIKCFCNAFQTWSNNKFLLKFSHQNKTKFTFTHKNKSSTFIFSEFLLFFLLLLLFFSKLKIKMWK